jgi:hypothetical protein
MPRRPRLDAPESLYRTIVLYLLQISAGLFTPLESPAIHGGDDINKTSIPHRKVGVKATSFLTG